MAWLRISTMCLSGERKRITLNNGLRKDDERVLYEEEMSGSFGMGLCDSMFYRTIKSRLRHFE